MDAAPAEPRGPARRKPARAPLRRRRGDPRSGRGRSMRSDLAGRAHVWRASMPPRRRRTTTAPRRETTGMTTFGTVRKARKSVETSEQARSEQDAGIGIMRGSLVASFPRTPVSSCSWDLPGTPDQPGFPLARELRVFCVATYVAPTHYVAG